MSMCDNCGFFPRCDECGSGRRSLHTYEEECEYCHKTIDLDDDEYKVDEFGGFYHLACREEMVQG